MPLLSKEVQYWFTSLRVPQLKWPPYTEGQKRPKKEARHSRLVRDSFNKQGNLNIRLVLGNHKTSVSPHLPTRIFKFYRGGLNWVQSYIPSRWCQQHIVLSRLCSRKRLPLWEWWVERTCTFQEQGRRMRSLQLPGSRSWFNRW